MTSPTAHAPSIPSSRLVGRTALVTGSTSGIGAAIARTLASDGATAVVSGRVDVLVNNAGIYPATLTEQHSRQRGVPGRSWTR